MAARKPTPRLPKRPLDIPEDDWSEAVRREAAVRPLVAAGSNSRPVLDAAAAVLGISTSQVYRLIAQYRPHPLTGSLVVTKPGPRKGTGLLPGEVEHRIEDAIDRVFKTRECPSLEKLRREIRADCNAAGLQPPSRKAIQARLSARSLRELMKARKGSEAARQALLRFALACGRPSRLRSCRSITPRWTSSWWTTGARCRGPSLADCGS